MRTEGMFEIRVDPLLYLASAASNVSYGIRRYIELKRSNRNVDEKAKKYLEHYKSLLKILKNPSVAIVVSKVKEISARSPDHEYEFLDSLDKDIFEQMLEGKLPVEEAQKLKEIIDAIAMDSLLRFRYNFMERRMSLLLIK